ncbi:MAG: hypothetical protein GY861_16425 [bacterium]|nr:hypothetical protein [bacterium]
MSKCPQRGHPGEANHHAKVTEEIVRTIRSLYKTGDYTYIELGAKYGLAPCSVHCIVSRKTWKHVI